MNGWAKLPRVLADALIRDDLDFDGFAIVAFLVAAREYASGEYVGTLEKIAADLRWEHTPDYLSKKLRELREGDWLAFETRPGQRKPYVIRLGSRLLSEPTSDSTSDTTSDSTSDGDTPPQSEVTSESPRSGAQPIPQPAGAEAAFQPPTIPRSKEREQEREGEPAGAVRLPRDGSRPSSFQSPASSNGTAPALVTPAAVDHQDEGSEVRIIDDCMACGERPEDGVADYGPEWLCDRCAAERGLPQPGQPREVGVERDDEA